MLRAIRLVVDTGLHWGRWSRDQVVTFFREHSAIDSLEIESETDRYIVWPAQALAYKVGQREILALREEARAAMGAGFDIRAFHDHLLSGGALPLGVLRRRMEAWMGK
jgi:uncharacterized protein (DUF885 family)